MEELYPDNKRGSCRKKAALNRLILILQFSLFFLPPLSKAVEIHAVSFELPSPPFLRGPLESNAMLAEAERSHEGKISVPHSYVRYKDEIYAVTAAGQVVNVVPCRPVIIADLAPRSCNGPKACGHLVSIRLSSKEMLLVLDAYRGLFEVHPITGVTRQLYSSASVVNGRPSRYLSDVVELPDGRIVMSDASAIFDYASRFWIMFEGRADGRLIELNPNTGHVKEVMASLAYPSGLELTFDRTAFLVAEASRSRIYRVDLDRNRSYYKTLFHENLPGMPEHIRQTIKGGNKGSYWVGLTFPRYQGDVSVLDQYSAQPAARNFLAKMRSEQQLRMMYNRRGLAVELDLAGRVINSMHDPTSRKVTEVTEVIEHGGLAYVGTRRQSTVIRVVTSASRLSIDSMIQVMRSRCKVTEDKIPEAKEALRRQILRRKSAASSNQTPSGINTQASMTAGSTQTEQSAQQPMLTQNKPQTGQQNSPSSARNLKTIRQGLSRIQKILNQRGLQNKKASTGTTPMNKQASDLPRTPAQTTKNTQRVPLTPKYNQPPQSQSFSQGLAHQQQQQQAVPHSPPQNSFDRIYMHSEAKLPVGLPPQNNRGTFSSPNRGGLQSSLSLPGVPPTSNDKTHPNNMRHLYQQNIPKLPNIPIPPALHDHYTSGTGQVYAPNGNVPLPFSVTGFHQNFADPSPPARTRPTRPNFGQMPGSYQDSGFGPYDSYKPVQNNAPTDPDSPFLPHGLVPTGHHQAVGQSAHYDGGNQPQIVHKVVDGQMISQIIVPDIETILYDRAESKTTIAPFVVPRQKSDIYKSEMFKPQTPAPSPPQISPQNENEKKLALGGFLGITAKPVQKAPIFNLGPEMVNTFPEFGQMVGSALDASPMGIYGSGATARPPVAADSNAAIALRMFTGVNRSAEPEKPLQTSQDTSGSPSSQGQEKLQDSQILVSKEISSPAAALKTLPITDGRNLQTTDIQNMQASHPGDDSVSAAFSRFISNSNSAAIKSENQSPRQSLLKHGLQQLRKLFHQEESRQTDTHSTPTAAFVARISPTLNVPTVASSSTTASQQNEELASSKIVGSHPSNGQRQTITQSHIGPTSIVTSQQNSAPALSGDTSLVTSLSGAAGTHLQQPQNEPVASSSTTASQQNEELASSKIVGSHPSNEQRQTITQSHIGPTTIVTSQQNSAPALSGDTSLVTSLSGAAGTHLQQPQNKPQQHSYSRITETPNSSVVSGINSEQDHNQRHSHDSSQAQPQQQVSKDETTTSNLSQLSPLNHQHETEESQQRLTPLSPNPSPQPEQSTSTSSANQDQQSNNSHGFIQIYQDGKYIVIPLSPNMLQTLSSSLGASITGSQPSGVPTASTSAQTIRVAPGQ